ncbi:MAG: AAA family ATPase [Blautia sp.]|nr:AAA family ATPase [Blautia sp.]
MGIYLNPGNSGFTEILKSDYVDKTGLISLINSVIGTKKKLICISRPRRFGKSYAAQMLCAYYDKVCDSHKLFDKYKISEDVSYMKHLNQYDVIYLDMTGIIGETTIDDLVAYTKRNIIEEIRTQYPEIKIEEGFAATLVHLVELTGNKVVMIIDEWDAPIREFRNHPEIQKEYLEFLRSLFKNSGATSRIFAAAYMTGILPIKKDGSQSAISDFEEYTMIRPWRFGEYVGFTQEEVKILCEEHGVSFGTMRQWYDGYEFRQAGPVYNPNSVMKAIYYDEFDSYWTETSAAESLMEYISQDYNGLTKTIAELIGGVNVKVNTNGFANDLVTFKGKDDVLTLMIHLGYLAYNAETKTVHIPNEEIRLEFQKSIREVNHTETQRRLQESDRLFLDTIEGNEEAVALQIEKVHREETAPLHYNKEDSLRSVIKLAYYTYRDHYLQWEELPSGEGYADIVYLPKHDSDWPALVVELKWNESAEGAVAQILNKKYPESLKGYGSEILLVGISYQKDAYRGDRKHTCRIVKAYC